MNIYHIIHNDTPFVIEGLHSFNRERHDVGGFDCKNEAVSRWVRERLGRGRWPDLVFVQKDGDLTNPVPSKRVVGVIHGCLYTDQAKEMETLPEDLREEFKRRRANEDRHTVGIYIDGLAVDGRFHRHGIGQTLMYQGCSYFFAQVRLQNVGVIFLRAQNNAIDFYRELGFAFSSADDMRAEEPNMFLKITPDVLQDMTQWDYISPMQFPRKAGRCANCGLEKIPVPT